VAIVAGDTKVVERGKADGLYVTTAGVGEVPADLALGSGRVEPGDRVLVSGTLGDHGIAVMIARGGLELEVDLESDTAPVHELAASLLRLGPAVRWMRDPTRGGLATALNELAGQAQVAVRLAEAALPVAPAVTGACEILGIDPLYVASEGRLVAVVAPEQAEAALAGLREHPLGAGAADVGEIGVDPPGLVLLETAFGGSRIVDVLVGDPLPRIC
jgi:hydrogenase expression/formation protein HypE